MGLDVFMATMIISKARMMLKEKKISSIKAGSGRTSKAITIRTAAGIAREVAMERNERLDTRCRKFVRMLSAKSKFLPFLTKLVD